MSESIELSTMLPVRAKRLYEAWLNAEEHAAFTGDPATCEPVVGGHFTAGGDYISGTNVVLEPYRRIVQRWRTTEFPEGSPDSLLEVLLEELQDGTRLILRHSNLPAGQGEMYRQGWQQYYLEPLRAYFASA
jgi:activator of HSP90 ATPase